MTEHVLFNDLPAGGKEGKFHSAVLTTYAVDLLYFDCHLRNSLHRKQITSINILADSNQIDTALQYVSPRYLSHIGRDYCLSEINSPGAFHPKINFFVGQDAALVLIGSGNLTASGHGKNHEAFTGFMADTADDSQRPLIEECWRYVERFASRLGDFERRRILAELPANCAFLDSDYPIEPHRLHSVGENIHAALLYNEPASGILQQMAAIIPMETVTRITVQSPFYDDDGATLALIAGLCPNARMDILLQPDCSLPPCNIADNERMRFYNFDLTERGKAGISKLATRTAHAKIYIFEAREMNYCVVGSANATKAGLGTMSRRGINDEFCVLYAAEERDFAGMLGLNPSGADRIDVKALHRDRCGRNDGSDAASASERKIRVITALYAGGSLRVSCDMVLPEGTHPVLNDGDKDYAYTDFTTDGLTAVAGRIDDPGKLTMTCHVADSTGKRISNKVFLNRIDSLNATDPSPSAREINRVIYKIESDGYDGLEVIDMLTEVMTRASEPDNSAATHLRIPLHSQAYSRPADDTLPEIHYNPAYDSDVEPAADAASTYRLTGNRASRLIESIEESIRKRIRDIDSENMDEEEEAEATASRPRRTEPDDSIALRNSDIPRRAKLPEGMMKQFGKLLERRDKHCVCHGSGPTRDDLSYFALTMFAAIDACYLSRFLYDLQGIAPAEIDFHKKKLYDSLDRVMESDGLKTLDRFAAFVRRHQATAAMDDDFRLKGWRAIKYALLYATFYLRYAELPDVGEPIIARALNRLTDIFGIPSGEYLRAEYEPLIRRYNEVFKFSYVERAAARLKLRH